MELQAPSKTEAEIIEWLQENIARETSQSPSKILTNRPFIEFGLDSIVVVTLVSDLEDWLGVSLDPTVLWEFPNIEVLSKWLVESKLRK